MTLQTAIGLGVMTTISAAALYLISLGMHKHRDDVCPHCGSRHREHLWDTVWVCTSCYRGYDHSPAGNTLLSDDVLADVLAAVITHARENDLPVKHELMNRTIAEVRYRLCNNN